MCIAQPFSRIEVHSKASKMQNCYEIIITYISACQYVFLLVGTCAYWKHVTSSFCERLLAGIDQVLVSPKPCGI